MSGTVDREFILAEIRRVSAQTGGRAVGRMAFERETGIRESDWLGRFAGKRRNGAWFALSAEDVTAFRRRKFM